MKVRYSFKIYSFFHSRSLQGLDNIVADGAAGFQTMERIVDDLKEKGSPREWCIRAQQTLQERKRYLKTDYQVHCTEDSSPCKDHCQKFALSDPVERDFKEECDHGHHLRCYRCEDLKDVLDDIKQQILESSASMYSKEYQEDLLYDFEQARTDIFQWKSHILRSVNQDKTKQDVIRNLSDRSALVVMDWAMKFLQMKYREKQSDWFAKRGISWHVSTVILKQDASSDVEVQTYAHLFDYCQQDWFAVCSIFENLLKNILTSKPLINSVFLRSDEAGCYHNNALIASLKDVGLRLGVKVKRYDYSEPAYGKDVCDRILCPMKSSIRCYCDEGHDINCAANMRTALLERPVRGVSASVCVIDDKKNNLKVNKIDGFSKLHNFTYDDKGLRVWRAYDIEPGKCISFDDVVVEQQEATGLIVQENGNFFTMRNARHLHVSTPEINDAEEPTEEGQLFECPEPGCQKVFKSFCEIEMHAEIGNHGNRPISESIYDRMRREWAKRFSTIDPVQADGSTSGSGICSSEETTDTPPSDLSQGWALSKPRVSTRFSPKVKTYLNAKFELGERTGLKADPNQVSADMRNARDEENNRRFSREEWLTQNQIKSYFSRLASAKRKGQQTEDLDDQAELEDIFGEQEENSRQLLINSIIEKIGLRHPICYDVYDLCEYCKSSKLSKFNVVMLKAILKNFDISFKSKDRKKDLVEHLAAFVQKCPCFDGPE